MCPHPPYLFGADGEKVKPIWTLNPWKPKEMYVNQLIFLNTLVKALVDEILTKSEIPPIIILQADHGTASECGDVRMTTLTIESIPPAHACNRERMRIFNAYYLPGGGSDLLYERISPVNTFRVIFNFYFDASYELLSDYSYLSFPRYRYQFIDVTKEVGYD